MPDRCICCGEIIPEGRMVCPNCEEGVTNQNKKRILVGTPNMIGMWKNLFGDSVDYIEQPNCEEGESE